MIAYGHRGVLRVLKSRKIFSPSTPRVGNGFQRGESMSSKAILRQALGLFLLSTVWTAASAGARAENRLALVIGNNQYPGLSAGQQLLKAVNDSKAVAAALEKLHFKKVIRGANLGRQGMIDKLAEFTGLLETGDTAVFFYAGHGVAINGVNYLVPSDVPPITEASEARVRGASIPENQVMEEIQSKNVRVVMMVLDACRDNPFPRAAAGRSVGSKRGLAEAQPVRGVFAIYSAGIGQSALDRLEPGDPDPNSVFTRVFVKSVVKPGLHLGDLAVEVREKVARLALQAKDPGGQPAPHEQTPAYYDQTLGGKIYLAGTGPVREAQPASPGFDPRAMELSYWESVRNSKSAAAFQSYLDHYPKGNFAALARMRVEELQKTASDRPQTDPAPVQPEARNLNKPARTSDFSAKASFDCSGVDEPIGQLICSDADLAEWDGKLAIAYRQRLERAEDRRRARQQQRDWLAERYVRCRIPRRGVLPADRVEFARRCVLEMTRRRVSELATEEDGPDAGPPRERWRERRLYRFPYQSRSGY
jgi:uncharacterized protein YecT (DUF1311 family)